MKSLFKLLLGNFTRIKEPIQSYSKENSKAIWNNDHQDDNGIEKIVRLFLSSSQLFFPEFILSIYSLKKGAEYEDLAVDLYVILKVSFPLILMNHWQNNFRS
jgi:hypothetical protein